MKRILILSLLVLSACSTAPRRTTLPPVIDATEAPPPSPEAAETVEVPVPPPAPTGGAVVALLDRADAYRQSGDVRNEAATLERALRISPRDAHLWNRLAATRLKQGKPRQAEQLALKSNALARGDTQLRVQNWRLVAKARWALNDSKGARAAEQKVRDLAGR